MSNEHNDNKLNDNQEQKKDIKHSEYHKPKGSHQHQTKSRDKRNKKIRTIRRTVNIVVLIIIIYLAILALSMFGGEGISTQLRSVDVINTSAEFVEENVIMLDSLPELEEDTDKSDSDGLTIVVSEDVIYYNGEEIETADLEDIISDNDADTVILEDDSAKRVTYAAVYDELERIGVVIDEN